MELIIKKENAITAYKNADNDGKKLLADLIGKEVFISGKITDRVKTFEDACEVLEEEIQLPFNKPTTPDHLAINAVAKLIIIARALNEGWTPDWNNSNEYKWYPWFKMYSGFGFDDAYDVYTYSNAYVGSRLCFKSEELAKYAGQQFESIYKEYLTLS